MDGAFEAFWAVYPKKRKKGDARKAFKALKPDSELVRTMIAAVIKWSASPEWQKEGGQFIPYPATWIRAEGWEDELTVEPPKARQPVALVEERQLTPEQLEENRRRIRELISSIGK